MPLNGTRLRQLSKGFRGRSKNCKTLARRRAEKALQYQYRDRRQRKRVNRGAWIQQINAATRQHGLSYSRFAQGLTHTEVKLDRKALAELAVFEPYSFRAVVQVVDRALVDSQLLPYSPGQASRAPLLPVSAIPTEAIDQVVQE
jgi:large subunit ribosomal protein L20